MNKIAALYARVSSDRQKEQHTIASQSAALREYAQTHHYTIPSEWVFEDEGYSGHVLARPGLERLRDLCAEGVIETVLIYDPDRLSRNFAYQTLLLEELARCGTEVVFLKVPNADTPESRLLLQFKGMIAEYERAQITERCRRGKRYQAKAGNVSVLSSVAPYGYRYVKKTQSAKAYYEVVESEAEVVRQIFTLYRAQNRSLRSIARMLNEQKVPTRSKRTVWQHSTLLHLLKNSAYQGWAAFGKTERGVPSQRLTRLRRLKGLGPTLQPVHRPRPAQEWIKIPVPALVSQETFALVQERLGVGKALAARNTKTRSVLQGLLVCAQCGYAFYRMSTHAQGEVGRYRYYRCLGSDRKRPAGRVCSARPVRVEQLDNLVWQQVWQLLNEPQLMEKEIERRLQEHQQSSPVEQRKANLTRERTRLGEQTDKLIDAYQEGLIDLTQLRNRVPEVKKKQTALERELESLNLQVLEHNQLVGINASIAKFTAQLQKSAETLDVEQKQRIVRLLVRQVVVGAESITIHHCIPLPGARDRIGGGVIDCGQGVPPSQGR